MYTDRNYTVTGFTLVVARLCVRVGAGQLCLTALAKRRYAKRNSANYLILVCVYRSALDSRVSLYCVTALAKRNSTGSHTIVCVCGPARAAPHMYCVYVTALAKRHGVVKFWQQ